MNLLKRWRRRLVKTSDQVTTRNEAKALWFQYAGLDDRVVALVESYNLLLDERADIIGAEREFLVGVLIREQGTYGPEEYGKGYYDAFTDAADIVSKGE